MRFPDPTRFVPFLVRLGWVTASAPNPDPQRVSGNVFFFRGNAIAFSNGFGTLCGRLRREGVWAEDLRCRGDTWACRRLVTDRDAGRLRGPVILVGHSCGGRSALFGAERLRRQGIAVDLIVCLDVALPPPVPANVRRAVNLYLSGRRLYPAGRLRPAPGASPDVANVDLNAPGSPIDARGLCHLNVTGRPAVQDYVMGEIMRCAERSP